MEMLKRYRACRGKLQKKQMIGRWRETKSAGSTSQQFTYIGESKRSWKSRGTEHKPGTNGNVGSAVKQHAQTTGHDIHPNCASSLETGVKTKEKRLFLESLHYFLDKNSVNEKAPFQRGYPSLVFSVRNNEQ